MSEENNEVVKAEDKEELSEIVEELIEDIEDEITSDKKNEESAISKIKTKLKKMKWRIIPWAIIAGIVILAIIILPMFIQKEIERDKIAKLTLKDIGVLCTQEAYITQVGVINESRQLVNVVDIPLTRSVCIFSFDVHLMAGYDFESLKIEKTLPHDDVKGKIIIELPLPSLFTKDIVAGSYVPIYRSESIFNDITDETLEKKKTALVEEAYQQAIANGLLVNAKENAKKVIKSFIYNILDEEQYDIEFIDVEETYY